MKVSRFAVISMVFVLLLAGCRSHKNVVRGGASGGSSHVHIDYSSEVTDGMGRDLVEEARGWLGTPYRYGGADRSGTDCSGLVMELYRMVCATRIPRTTTDQKSYCTKVARNKARVGDLMFFGPSKGAGSVSHVGLYIGKGEMIHASSSRGVMVSNVDAGYWGDRFLGVGRVDNAYDSWASTSRGKKSRKRDKNSTAPDVEETPQDVTPFNVVPVPAGEIAYSNVGALGVPTPVILPSDEAVACDVAPGEVVTAQASALPASSTAPSPASSSVAQAQGATTSIELLDLIINQKVDSIFSNQFMD